MFISGGAALDRELAEFYHVLGITMLEGYGLTETTATVTCNVPEAYRLGAVGRPVPGVDVTLAEDGEILVRGPTVMQGYHNDPRASSEAIDEDGWFHTGDVGFFDRDGFLIVTDRKKDLIVTSGGKNVAPQYVEGLLQQSPYISYAAVFGDARPFVTALVTLDEEAIMVWARERGVEEASYKALTQTQQVRELVQQHVDTVNRRLASFETIRKFAILEEDFSPRNQELTASGKVRRDKVYEDYRELIESFYAERY